MESYPGESVVCWLCDYWYLLLTVILLGLGAAIWLPSMEPDVDRSLEIILRWEGANDLDLQVTDPAGERIYFSHPHAASGGKLDQDSNAGCHESRRRPVERAYWPPERAPAGEYQIAVTFSRQCNADEATPFQITIRADGTSYTYTGQLEPPTPAQTLVTTFRYPQPSNQP